MSNKEFFVRHGLSVNNTVLTANVITNKVGIGTNNAAYTLDVIGNANISQPSLFVAGTNVLATLNSAYTITNAAYDSANSNWAVQNSLYTLANTIYDSANSNWTVQNAVYDLTNTVYASANSNWEVQNVVYATVNSSYIMGNAAYTTLNAAYTMANAGYATINSAYDSSNSNWTVQNLVYATVNANYVMANAAYTTLNSTYGTVNAVYASANSNWEVQNLVYATVNAAYTLANAAYANANSLAIGANTWANTVGVAGNNYASILAANNAAAGNSYTNTVGIAGNNYTNTVGVAGNNYTNSVGTAGNNYASILVANNSVGANNWANTKLSNTNNVWTAGSLNIAQDLFVNRNITNVTQVIFNTSTNLTPTTPGALTWSQDDYTLHFDMDTPSNVIQHIGQDLFLLAKNQTGSNITKGTVVRYVGTLGASGRLLIAPALGNNTQPSKYIMGVAAADIANGADGFVLARGKLKQIDTSMFSAGDTVYLSSTVSGGLANTAPEAPNNRVTVGYVINNDVNGAIQVHLVLGSSLADDELAKLNGLANGDFLRYNSANLRFENFNENATGPAINAVAAFAHANSVAIAANAWSNTVGLAGNNYTNTVGLSGNNYAGFMVNSSNSFADATYYKKTGGTVSGEMTVTGNVTVNKSLFVTGNVYFTDQQTLKIADPLIYLAGNNYTSDLVDIGFVANYVNATSVNVHTGLYRSSISKEYYLFQGYSAEPDDNYIDFAGNNFTLAVLNADLITSNLFLGGANAINRITSVYNTANAAFGSANSLGVTSNNWANAVGTAGNNYTNSVGTAGNNYMLYVTTSGNTYAGYMANSANARAYNIGVAGNNVTYAVGVAGNSYAQQVGTAGNNYTNTVGVAGNNYVSILAANNAVGCNAWANTVGTAGNNYTNAVGIAGNNYASILASNNAIGANNWANTIGTAGNNYTNYVGASTNAYATATYATQSNVAIVYRTSNVAFDTANAAFASANNVAPQVEPAFRTANNAYLTANAAYGTVNAAYASANSNWEVQNLVYATVNASYTLANSVTNKAFIFYQNTAPATSNAHDLWVNSDTGVVYENFGTAVSPIWAEFGPTSTVSGSPVGVIATSNLNFSDGSYQTTSATTIGTAGNNYLISVATSGNNYTNSVGLAGNNYAIVMDTAGNNYTISVGAASNTWANTVGTAGNNYAIVMDTAGNNYTSILVANNAVGANNWANTKLANSTGTLAGDLTVTGNTIVNKQAVITYTPAAQVNAAVHIAAANTKGTTGYADVFKLTNLSGGTNIDKWIRLNQTGGIEIINNAYNTNLLTITDSGDFTVAGNVTMSGIQPGYSANRPGFRVYGSGTTNNLTTTQNGTGRLTSNNFTVVFNQGSYLNTSTGVFTAPVAGLYQINLVARNSGYSSGIMQIAVVHSGTVACMLEFAASSSMNHAGVSAIVKMAVGETLVAQVLAGQINFDSNDNWSVAYIG